MSPSVHHYLYDKCDIILSKTNGFTMVSKRMSVWQQSVLWVTSSVFVARSGAFGWHNIFVIKLLQSDVFISLDQCIINYCYILHTYLASIVFWCDLAFKKTKVGMDVPWNRSNWCANVHLKRSKIWGYGYTDGCTICGHYTVVHKKCSTLLLSIYLPIIDWFSKLFHWHTLRTIWNNVVFICPTTP